MAAIVKVQVEQVGPTTAEGQIRDHRLLIDRPVAKGGEDRGPMGGELLLAALGGCFMSNMLAAIRAREAAISNVRFAIAGTLESAPSHFSAIRMTISADYEDRALMEKIIAISERACIVANTLKGAVDLAIELESEVVGEMEVG